VLQWNFLCKVVLNIFVPVVKTSFPQRNLDFLSVLLVLQALKYNKN
jgi:hypothetical protein